jgi:phosphoribosylaminoimidazolecarboxamide formyltransferase/IMP cyclohydrolase
MSISEQKSFVPEEGNMIKDPRSVPVRRALISVTDKTGLPEFVSKLHEHGVEVISTGGTAKSLKDDGIPVRDVSSYTGFPEIMDGRVKTLHPNIHGSILARRDNESHINAMHEHNMEGIDMVVVNLYNFTDIVAEGGDFKSCIENIDIGGPALIRAAAKNHEFVTVITDPQDYDDVLENMSKHDGATSYALRKRLAANAVAMTATYDSNIASWIASQVDEHALPRRISFSGNLKHRLRYGENPHQAAALYVDGSSRAGVAAANQIQGKELSYNNLNDTDAAFELVADFTEPTVAIIKHANPCGVASADNIHSAYNKALACDRTSAFGGIVALNSPLDAVTAEEIIKTFCEVIIAPSIEGAAMDILKQKEKIRVLTTGSMPDPTAFRRQVRTISGGLLVQDVDNVQANEEDFKVVTDREPMESEFSDMLFAFKVSKHVKSNTIVYAKDKATVGIGAGQMSRIDSARIAADKAVISAADAGLERPATYGSVVASDAFFPFADGLIVAAQAGATAVIQPGGSIRDEEVIAAANERGLAMIFTGIRHFRH